MNIYHQIRHALYQHITKTIQAPLEVQKQITIELITDPEKDLLGDITTNAALVLAKALRKNPQSLATDIATNFKNTYIERATIAGPGFINFTLTIQAFKAIMLELYEQGDQFFALDIDESRTTYLIEFVSANPTGPLHLGHGRGGIIGDVLGNIVKFLGHHVIKEFYINDAGAQITKLGQSFKVRCQQELGIDATIPEEGYQGEYLVTLARTLVKQDKNILEKPDSFFADYAKNALLQDLRTTLQKYGITFDVWFSEKSLHKNGSIDKAISILTQRGYTYIADGALWFKSTEFGDDKDRVLKKSDGSYTYIAADVAYLQNKLERGGKRLIYVLGQDHHSYVMRLKGIMAALGHNPVDLDVIVYQLVTIKESGQNVRMSKRAGRIVSLEDVIETVGADISRFFYLHRKADAHLDFDIDLALKHTDENPVYYIQYAYVRTSSMLEKALEHPELENLTTADIDHIGMSERLLLKKIISLKDLLKNISVNYQTHLLTYYVLELAHYFHRYYNDHRVIDLNNSKQSRARLMLVSQLRQTFALCFSLLEINKPTRM